MGEDAMHRAAQEGHDGSSLLWASRSGHPKVVELLLDRRADVDAADRVRICARRARSARVPGEGGLWGRVTHARDACGGRAAGPPAAAPARKRFASIGVAYRSTHRLSRRRGPTREAPAAAPARIGAALRRLARPWLLDLAGGPGGDAVGTG